jgi:anti-sigma B factor antagonist
MAPGKAGNLHVHADRPGTLRVTGDLDFVTAPGVAGTLRDLVATSTGPVTIDCGDLGFLDSSGLSVLVMCWRSLRAQDRELRLVGVTDELRRLLDITGLTEHLGASA